MKLNNIYKNAFEQKCFQLIVGAYETSLIEKVIQLNWNENDISHELFEKIDNNKLRLKWSISISREFHLSPNIAKEKGFSDHLPRIDFRMSQINSNLEYKYYCEAKRLKEKDSGLKRAYINEGMDRYISKKYPFGCMMGYLLDGKTAVTIKGINSLLEKDKRDTEILLIKDNKLLDSYFESNHSNIGTLKHLILDFTIIERSS